MCRVLQSFYSCRTLFWQWYISNIRWWQHKTDNQRQVMFPVGLHSRLLQKTTGMVFVFWSTPQQVRNTDSWKPWYMTNSKHWSPAHTPPNTKKNLQWDSWQSCIPDGFRILKQNDLQLHSNSLISAHFIQSVQLSLSCSAPQVQHHSHFLLFPAHFINM